MKFTNLSIPSFSKQNIAVFVIVLFHIAGLPFIVYEPTRSLFLFATPFTLLLSATLLFWNHKDKSSSFISFCVIAFGIGFGAELIGVQTGILFGDYKYSSILGWKIGGVPLIIGTNWWMCTYSCGVVVNQFYPPNSKPTSFFFLLIPTFTKAFIGAILMLLLDIVIEPVAMKLDFWQWQNHQIPLLNYGTWFIASFFLLCLFFRLPFKKENPVAVTLYLTLFLFFAALNFA